MKAALDKARAVPVASRAAKSGLFRLPSGKPLAEFALSAGFLASSLWMAGAKAQPAVRPKRRSRAG